MAVELYERSASLLCTARGAEGIALAGPLQTCSETAISVVFWRTIEDYILYIEVWLKFIHIKIHMILLHKLL